MELWLHLGSTAGCLFLSFTFSLGQPWFCLQVGRDPRAAPVWWPHNTVARERPPFLTWQLGIQLGIWIPSMEVELSLNEKRGHTVASLYKQMICNKCLLSFWGSGVWYLLGKGAPVCPQKKPWNALDVRCCRQHKETQKHAHRRLEHSIFSSRSQPDKNWVRI